MVKEECGGGEEEDELGGEEEWTEADWERSELKRDGLPTSGCLSGLVAVGDCCLRVKKDDDDERGDEGEAGEDEA